MKILLLLFGLLLSLAVCGKFRLTREYLLSRKWVYWAPWEQEDENAVVVLNPDGCIYDSKNQTKLYRQMWEMDEGGQWVKIIDSAGAEVIIELNTIILNKNSDASPQVVIIGYVLEGSEIHLAFKFYCLREYHDGYKPYKLDKKTLLSNTWNLNVKANGGLHETVVFRSNGDVYKADNKTLKFPRTTYDLSSQVGYLQLHIGSQNDNDPVRGYFVLKECFLNNNPLEKDDVIMVGGPFYLFPMDEDNGLTLSSISMSRANIKKFTINQQFLLAKRWTVHLGSNEGLHSELTLNPNGKIFNKDNKTELVPPGTWSFSEEEQWVYLEFHPDSTTNWTCNLNTVFVSENADIYPDVTVFGDFRSKKDGSYGSYSMCSLTISAPPSSSPNSEENDQAREKYLQLE